MINAFASTNGLTPDNPEFQQAFKEAFDTYLINSAIFFIFIAVVVVVLIVISRRTKKPKLKKYLLLTRKILLYATFFGWIIFTGIITGLIRTGL